MRRPKRNNSFTFKKFSPKQLKLLNFWRDASPNKDCVFMIADGAIRSGKTIACICSFLMWSMSTFTGQNFIIAGKTIGTLRKNVISPMLDILTAWGVEYYYNRSENYILIGTNTYYCYDANNESSQDKIQGLTAAGAYADEVALFPRSFTDQMVGRCSVEGRKIFLNCNPGTKNHYINTEYIQKAKEKNVYHLHFVMRDNLTLSEDILNQYESMFDGIFYRRYIKGEWCAAEGLCYPSFANDESSFIVDDEWLQEHPIMYGTVGVDFGGTKSGHAFCFAGFTSGYKEMVLIRDYYRKERIDPTQLEVDFIDFIKSLQAKYPLYECYCDSAEQTLIAGLESAAIKANVGINIINAIKSPINDRIAFTNSMMAQGRFFIHERCKATIDALESAVYDDKQETKDVRLDDGSTNIDSLDAMEYTAERLMEEIIYLR